MCDLADTPVRQPQLAPLRTDMARPSPWQHSARSGWIFPGQKLELTRARTVCPSWRNPRPSGPGSAARVVTVIDKHGMGIPTKVYRGQGLPRSSLNTGNLSRGIRLTRLGLVAPAMVMAEPPRIL
jgi:hypothetical protein